LDKLQETFKRLDTEVSWQLTDSSIPTSLWQADAHSPLLTDGVKAELDVLGSSWTPLLKSLDPVITSMEKQHHFFAIDLKTLKIRHDLFVLCVERVQGGFQELGKRKWAYDNVVRRALAAKSLANCLLAAQCTR
jgi:hypothetical protein